MQAGTGINARNTDKPPVLSAHGEHAVPIVADVAWNSDKSVCPAAACVRDLGRAAAYTQPRAWPPRFASSRQDFPNFGNRSSTAQYGDSAVHYTCAMNILQT
jgi:hypothetical protein